MMCCVIGCKNEAIERQTKMCYEEARMTTTNKICQECFASEVSPLVVVSEYEAFVAYCVIYDDLEFVIEETSQDGRTYDISIHYSELTEDEVDSTRFGRWNEKVREV